MKKNITINLFGSLYAIDEDAYELLNQYQNNMRRYFARKEGGEEIADDIERRVAELFAELKNTGVEAITIEHVQDIITRIGNPEEMDGTENYGTENSRKEETQNGETQGGETQKAEETARKKMFRNPDDKMLGGVCSGLACYFGIDALWMRLLMILLAWFSVGTMVVIYLVLWLIIPEARTPEDRLRMQGRPVNMENLRDEIVDKVRRTGRYAAMPETKRTVKGIVGGCLTLLAALLKGCLVLAAAVVLFFCALLLIGSLIALCVYYFALQAGTPEVFGTDDQGFLRCFVDGTISQGIYWVAMVSFLLLLALTLYIGIHSFARMMGRMRPLSVPARSTLVVLWLVLAILFIASSIQGGVAYKQYYKERQNEQQARHDAFQVRQQQDWLRREGWKVVRHEKCDSLHFVGKGHYYTGHYPQQYLHAYGEDRGMRYEAEKTVRVAPGVYTLEAMARANGKGCDIFVRTRGQELLAAVPAYGCTGGELWEEAHGKEAAGDSIIGMWRDILDANGGKGYGWSRVIIAGITVGRDSTVVYGVTNARSGQWEGTWFSATDFRLEPVKAHDRNTVRTRI